MGLFSGQAPRGTILGVAGGSLSDSDGWLGNSRDARAAARHGREGELRTAGILDQIANRAGGVTVLHDLRIPGYQANIDHIIVAGTEVAIIDSKVWKPGRYWTLAGTSRRGWEKVPHLDKQTMPMAQRCVREYLLALGLHADLPTPALIVWSSSKNGKMSLRWARPPGAQVIPADRAPRWLNRFYGKGVETADPAIVTALSRLLITSPTTPSNYPPRPPEQQYGNRIDPVASFHDPGVSRHFGLYESDDFGSAAGS